MRCPKCRHEQRATDECEQCGIIFSKYIKRQSRLEKPAGENPAKTDQPLEKPSRSWPVGLSLIIVILMSGGLGFLLGDRPSPKHEPGYTGNENKQALAHPVGDDTFVDPGSNLADKSVMSADFGQSPAEGLETATRATVLITTSWGEGSGFFIDTMGHIITNRHVVEARQEELDKLKARTNLLRNKIELQQVNLQNMERVFSATRQKDLRSKLKKEIDARNENVSQALDFLDKLEAQLANMTESSAGQAKVTLIDGSEYSIWSMELSDKYDLALLSISRSDTAFIQPAPKPLSRRQGQQVYAIGNPSGLRHSVTSGIISGYRLKDGNSLIQTDTPINPGNSGGPLIDETGKVLGVNTMILDNTEGIGFAIPISDVFREFSFQIQTDQF